MPPIYEGSQLISKMCIGAAIVAAVYCGSQSVLSGGSYVEPTPAALSPTSPLLSQQPLSICSFVRHKSEYVGNCFAVKDSLGTTRTIAFDSTAFGAGIVASATAMGAAAVAAGASASVFAISGWYDQSGLGNNFTTAARPELIFPNAPTNYEDGYVNYKTANGAPFLATPANFNVGGTANLAVHIVCKRLGYGGALNPYDRPGTKQTAIPSQLMGYGTSSANALIGSTPTTTQDSLGCTASVYGMPEELMLDEAEPSATAGWTNMWFNQSGSTVTGGGDVRKHWSGRPHGKAAASSVRLVLGANGSPTNQFNGAVREVIVYQGASPMPDAEAWAVGVWQSQQYQQQATLIEPRYYAIFTGQSNAVMHLNNATSGDGAASSSSVVRRFVPKFCEAMGINTLRVQWGTESKTCVGGTPLLKRPNIGDADAVQYWWDEDTAGPGNLATPGVGAYGNWQGTMLAVPGIKYKRAMVIHAQGEEDSKVTNLARADAWGAQTSAFFAWMRGVVSQPDMPIIVQPLSRYELNLTTSQYMRRIQKNVLGALPNVTIAADTGHLARGWDANEYAHFGSMSAWEATSGGAEDGYQRLAWQDALAAAHAFGASTFWRGPEVTGAAVSGPATIDLTIGYPAGCNGTDFSSSSGTYSGFRAFTSGGNLTVLSVAKISATKIQVTLSASVPAGTSIVYEPNYATYLTHMRDNNPVLQMPIASSDIFVVS